ncbi:efflux RND transporter periplasmic adaptor subunit [Vibrio cincinnatiensis]|uniref:efflux RND transporter periplasmic adaptor subunit n=1 Tax=Vibrio cincinnatiensis TaxID=675 RepID=UPI001EE082DC|nr:efflux RND transporter periplasmic adaptor subunit [Vibrio cincinnatiensis]MCG3726165.1 efflux RND transporter periplasmic adaptor subunit [Vibrio cincinnatiensis]
MKRTVLASALAAALLVSGCKEPASIAPSATLPLVVTQPVSVISYQPSATYIGRAEAVEDTDITAQVTGYLKERHFAEGQIVEKGQLLYSIEPSSFQAQLASAKAAVAQSEAAHKKASLDFKRAQNLLPRGSISQSEFDTLNANLLGAEAAVEASKAQLKLTEVNLSYTEIRAPFTGRISSSKVSQGDLLSPSMGVLTTLVSLDPIHTRFSLSERERLTYAIDKVGGDGRSEANAIEVEILLENGEVYPQLGTLDFLSNRIDVKTGTIAMRALLPNPEHRLLPGQHLNVVLRSKQANDVLVIPRKAVQMDLEGHFVMVLTDGNIVERRNVELGSQQPQGVIIHHGLNSDDIVVTQGLQRIRNGVAVRTQTAEEKEG